MYFPCEPTKVGSHFLFGKSFQITVFELLSAIEQRMSLRASPQTAPR